MINWIPVIELAVLAMTTLGTTVTLFMHSDSKFDRFTERMDQKLDENRKETYAMLNGIREEMRDFHSRLCLIEERRKNE